jgi:2-hydroxy-3-keto-5-methylthiopentenyl-1-phosphate phosphatase
MTMKAVILAGGLGTRLSEETYLLPKPLVNIGGKPILWHIMKLYSFHGINHFIICCGYKGYLIKEYFSNYPLHMSDITFDMAKNQMEVHSNQVEPWLVTLVNTGEKTMTGGRIKRIRDYVGQETFCLTYGDGVGDVNIQKLIRFHRDQQTLATLTAAYRSSFFSPEDYPEHGVAIATARAGNVIGGGDWAEERLLPDIMRSLLTAQPIIIRSPQSIRPWQHVLEPLSGYLLLAEKLYQEGPAYGEAWNFGPDAQDCRTVEWIVNYFCQLWGDKAVYTVDSQSQPHEARFLKLDCSKARTRLDWRPRWKLETALEKTVEWLKEYQNKGNIKQVCLKQIDEYIKKSVKN